MYAVVRESESRFYIESQKSIQASTTERLVITILNSKATTCANLSVGYDKLTKVGKVSRLLYMTHREIQIKKLKAK